MVEVERNLLLGAFFTILGVALVGTVSAAKPHKSHGGKPLQKSLTGSVEVPGPGDPDGNGMVRLTLNPGQGEICVSLAVSDIATATAAHIHEAPVGMAGPVVVALPTPDAGGSADGCVEVSRNDIKDIMRRPNEYYVNIHNAEYPAGALRGQL